MGYVCYLFMVALAKHAKLGAPLRCYQGPDQGIDIAVYHVKWLTSLRFDTCILLMDGSRLVICLRMASRLLQGLEDHMRTTTLPCGDLQ